MKAWEQPSNPQQYTGKSMILVEGFYSPPAILVPTAKVEMATGLAH